MGTRLTFGLTRQAVADMGPGERLTLIDTLKTVWLPQIDAETRQRERFGLKQSGGEIVIRVPRNLRGKSFRVLPGLYCPVIKAGTTSLVACDLEVLDKGARRLLRALEDTS